MKKEIHPEYFKEAKVTCVCGAEYSVGSTVASLNIEICANCHPFYTGAEKIMDTAGRVEKFKTRIAAAKPKAVARKKEKKGQKKEQKKQSQNTTVKKPSAKTKVAVKKKPVNKD